MHRVTPSSAEDLAFALQEAASKRRNIETAGNNSKRLMGGPVRPADVLVCTRGLRRILHYEPNDLTISVEAGMAFADLQKLLAPKRSNDRTRSSLSSAGHYRRHCRSQF